MGLAAKSYTFMCSSKFLMGVGMEIMATGKSLTIAHWFMGKELAFAANVNMAISRQFYTFNGFITPKIE